MQQYRDLVAEADPENQVDEQPRRRHPEGLNYVRRASSMIPK